MGTMKQLKRSMIAMFLVVCMICSNTLPAFADQAVASTMRLAKTEGTVSITNKNGRDMGTKADMKLFNGYNLGTEQASYAWIGLDDSKIIKLDAVSEAEIQKKGKDLEVLLNSGNLFFNVTESLKADETLNIRTSTMVTGIRGTCGWVKVLDSWRTEVFILEGSVECWVMDPVTGQAKTVRLGAGQKATFVVYDQMREGDKCDIIMGTYGENDIDPFVAVELLNDPDLRDRVGGATGFNIGAIVNGAEERLDAKEQDVNQKNQVIQNQLFSQPNTVKDPVFETSRNDDTDRPSSGGSGSGSGSGGSSSGGTSGGGNTFIPGEELDPEPEEVDTIELQMPVTATELNKYLQSYNVILHGSGSPNGDILSINTTVTVPDRGADVTELAVDADVTINVNQGNELRVNGTLDTEGNIINNGTITNTSMNTLDIAGYLQNNDGAEINNTGRMVIAQGLDNYGYMGNAGELQSDLGLYGGTLEIMQGSALKNSAGNDISDLVLEGGDVDVLAGTFTSATVESGCLTLNNDASFGTVTVSDVNAPENTGGTAPLQDSLLMNGGTVTSLDVIKGLATVSGGNVGTAGLGVDNNNNVSSLNISGGTVETANINSGALNVSLTGNVESVNGYQGSVNVKGGMIGTATMEGANLNLTGGSVEVVEQSAGQFAMQTNSYAESVTLRDDATADIAGGEITELTVDSAQNIEMSDGVIADGMKVSGTAPQISISGGTINAVNADAAIEVDATVGGTDTVTPNVIIQKDSTTGNDGVDVVIDGGAKTAILVNAGVVEADITDMVDSDVPAVESVIIKADSKDNIVKTADSGNNPAYVYVPYNSYDPSDSANVNIDDTIHTLLHEENGFVLRMVDDGLQYLVAQAEENDTVQLKDNTEIAANPNSDEVALTVSDENGKAVTIDLNGHVLWIESLAIEENNSLKVIDSKETGTFSYAAIYNSGELTFESVAIDSDDGSILNNSADCSVIIDGGTWNLWNVDNDASIIVNDAEVTQGEAYPDVYSRFYNAGNLVIDSGEWYIANIENYGKVSMTDVDGTIEYFYNSGGAEAANTVAEFSLDGGEWKIGDSTGYNSNYNEGIMVITDAVIDLSTIVHNINTLTISGGSINGTADLLIDTRGELNISNGTELTMDSITEMQAMIVVTSGIANIGGEGNPVELTCGSGSGSAVISNVYLGGQSSEDEGEWISTINLTNAKIAAGQNSAVHLSAGRELIINSDVEITSESEYGAIWCDAISNNNNDYIGLGSPIKLNGGTITNKHDKSGVINQNYFYGSIESINPEDIAVSLTQIKTEMLDGRDNCYSTVLVPSVDQIKTTLVAERGNGVKDEFGSTIADLLTVISNSYVVYYGEGDHVVEYLAYTSSNALQTSSVSLMSLRPTQNPDAELEGDLIEGDLPEDNDDLGGSGADDVIGDSSDNDDDDTSSDDIETSTDSDATEREDSTETASDGNATGNGEPMTGAPAAIPLAAALLGIWMSMPKEYKRRNRKEC